jgi:hypothetical protein
MEGIIIINLN